MTDPRAICPCGAVADPSASRWTIVSEKEGPCDDMFCPDSFFVFFAASLGFSRGRPKA
eukprot:CAMPEP_0119558102 /NCGR_PEP_ID=MMETSP1352-20130426/10055_1 /TAXON_ID=265584 /ORGANISM="Stauroneis constricta, Strain CCMP1120" /LENGTH=57 /DNA_ID=CAMNT_0007605339 /DNA_START=8 /DNA_END=178 /DNA_ORIENTATION=+